MSFSAYNMKNTKKRKLSQTYLEEFIRKEYPEMNHMALKHSKIHKNNIHNFTFI